MKSILRKVAGLAIATVLAFGMFSCNIGNKEESTPKEINKEEPAPTKIALVCMECSGTHEIDIEGCTTWEDAIAKNRCLGAKINKSVYYSAYGCSGGLGMNGDNVMVSDDIDVKQTYSIKN